MFPHELPKRNDGILENQAWKENGEVAQNSARNSTFAGVHHCHGTQEARKVEIGSWEGLNQGESDQELLIGHPSRIDGVGFEKGDDDWSSTKDDGAYKVKSRDYLTVFGGGRGRDEGAYEDGGDQQCEKDGKKDDAQFL